MRGACLEFEQLHILRQAPAARLPSKEQVLLSALRLHRADESGLGLGTLKPPRCWVNTRNCRPSSCAAPLPFLQPFSLLWYGPCFHWAYGHQNEGGGRSRPAGPCYQLRKGRRVCYGELAAVAHCPSITPQPLPAVWPTRRGVAGTSFAQVLPSVTLGAAHGFLVPVA